jgi:alpha-L-rhamnosidase
MNKLRSFIFAALLLAPLAALHAAAVTNLRCEYRENPLGIDVVKPRLSWVIEDRGQTTKVRGQRQTAYQVLVASTPELLAKDQGDLWDSGKVTSDQSIQVEYKGKQLESRMRCYWKVQIWTSDLRPLTSSSWRKPAFWTMGMLKPDDWQAKWIGPGQVHGSNGFPLEAAQWIWFPGGEPTSSAPAGTCYFRRVFSLPAERKITKASIQMTADNGFELYVNGKKAGQGDDFNMPVTVDLTGILQAGSNTLAVAATNAGDDPTPAGLIAVLTVEFAEGSPMVICTDAQWKSQREKMEGWETGGFDDASWPVAKAVWAFGAAPWGQLTGQLTGQIGGQFHPWLRRTFEVTSEIKCADIYVNTPGNYELYVNGKRVGEDVLAQAYSDFRKRMFYTAHDVAGLLRKGINCIALWLGPGWYQPGYGNPYNSSIVRAQLEMETTHGRQVIGTDASWRAAHSCISQVGTWSWNAMGGEKWDAANYIAGWNLAGFDDRAWALVLEVAAPDVATSWLAMPGNRAGKPIPPARIYPVNNKWVIDFGTTLTGWMRLKLADLKPGQQITIDYADLDKPELEHMPGADGFQTFNQQDICMAGKRTEDVFRSKFNQHAFRYAVIAGLSRAPAADEAEALPVMTALEPTGAFECSNPLFNRIHQITVATCRSQTPCGVLGGGESREKEGYGDGGSFLTGFLYNFRSDTFFRKWLADFRDGQSEDGFIAHTAPQHASHGGGPPWGGQASELTRRLHLYYGERRAIAEAYPALRKYVDYIETHTKDDVLRYYCPYGGPGGWFLGDWVSPSAAEDVHGFNEETDDEKEFLNNCYRLLLWDHLAGFAGTLGDQAEAKRCRERRAVIRPLVHKTWFDPGKKRYRCSRQAYLVMALQARIMPPELRPAILKQLEDEIVVAKKGHLDAGMLGSSLMLDLLTRGNRSDLVETIMRQTTYPGWGFLVEKRKVTTWPETWTGWGSQIIQVVGTPGAWFYEGLAGIRPDPAATGFKQSIIKPALVGDLTWVKCHHDSPYGRIVSNWKREGDKLIMEVTIPDNTTATVYVPAKAEAGVTESGTPTMKAKGVQFLRMEHSAAVYAVGSGTYRFHSILPVNIK